MIIVKMNETTVECSIAASELHEIGLTPEAVRVEFLIKFVYPMY